MLRKVFYIKCQKFLTKNMNRCILLPEWNLKEFETSDSFCFYSGTHLLFRPENIADGFPSGSGSIAWGPGNGSPPPWDFSGTGLWAVVAPREAGGPAFRSQHTCLLKSRRVCWHKLTRFWLGRVTLLMAGRNPQSVSRSKRSRRLAEDGPAGGGNPPSCVISGQGTGVCDKALPHEENRHWGTLLPHLFRGPNV